MRHLPYCHTFATDHHRAAWVVIAEVLTLVKEAEEQEGATLICLDVKMDDEATYYANLVMEFHDEEMMKQFEVALEALS